MPLTRGETWSWSLAGRGALLALPAVFVLPVAPVLALALTLGTVSTVSVGRDRGGAARGVIPLTGALSACSLLAVSLIPSAPGIAVPAMFAVAFLASLAAARRRWGDPVLRSAVPATGMGLAFPPAPETIAVAGCLLGGALYAWGVSFLPPTRIVSHPDPTLQRGRSMLAHGVLSGTACAAATALGIALAGPVSGWSTVVVLLAMRPFRGQLMQRSAVLAGGVLLGGCAAIGVRLATLDAWMWVMLIVLLLAAAQAVGVSRRDSASMVVTFIALSLLLATGPSLSWRDAVELCLETMVAVTIAVLVVAVTPTALSLVRSRALFHARER